MADLFGDGKSLDVLNDVLPEGLHPTLVDMAEQMFLALAEDAEAVHDEERDKRMRSCGINVGYGGMKRD